MTNLFSAYRRWLNPTTLISNIIFTTIATLLLAVAAWLMQAGLVSSLTETALSQRYSPWSTLIPIRIWMRLAAIIAIVLPGLALPICWGWRAARRLILLYLSVLVVQILTESIFSNWKLSGMNFIVGFIYTSHRVWQLWCYQQYIRHHRELGKFRQNLVLAIFIGGIVFWTLNWLILLINLVTRING